MNWFANTVAELGMGVGVPANQLWGPLEPYKYAPAWQLLHTGAVVAPVTPEPVTVPAAQNMHAESPADAA